MVFDQISTAQQKNNPFIFKPPGSTVPNGFTTPSDILLDIIHSSIFLFAKRNSPQRIIK